VGWRLSDSQALDEAYASSVGGSGAAADNGMVEPLYEAAEPFRWSTARALTTVVGNSPEFR